MTPNDNRFMRKNDAIFFTYGVSGERSCGQQRACNPGGAAPPVAAVEEEVAGN
jgi:hypothetical protein